MQNAGLVGCSVPQDSCLLSGLTTEPLRARSGAIQAAVALELPADARGPFSHAQIKYNMLNGQLPNLDLVNLLVRMVEKEALEPTLFGKVRKVLRSLSFTFREQ